MFIRFTSLVFLLALISPVFSASDAQIERYSQWLSQMKNNARGPFTRLRWFCEDGAILPPEPYACEPHGGGRQHGEWSQQTNEIRAAGYHIANVYSAIDIETFTRETAPTDGFMQMLIEQFLIQADDGWILRRARYYRGAFQEEGERDAAQQLLTKLSEDSLWWRQRFLALRAAARLLPHGVDSGSIQAVRQMSMALAQRDPAFVNLKNKIHSRPQALDAIKVREYAQTISDPSLSKDLRKLAKRMDDVYTSNAVPKLQALARKVINLGPFSSEIRQHIKNLQPSAAPLSSFTASAKLLASLRDHLGQTEKAILRMQMIDVSLAVEAEHFVAATKLRQEAATMSRFDQLQILTHSAEALYGVGLLAPREIEALRAQFSLLNVSAISLAQYKASLDYLKLVLSWGTQNLRFFFSGAMQGLAEIEPLAKLFIQDQLRGSPLFFYAQIIDGLLRDANQLAGVSNELFGAEIGAGLRALNPGIAQGTLYLAATGKDEQFDPNGIYLLPETVAELPPVAGILTAGEGNPLSHIQLLARNLGIPNVGVDESLIKHLKAHQGKTVLLAVSAKGSVRLSEDKGQWQSLFGKQEQIATLLIKPDLEKLDLIATTLLPLSGLRAEDSGRIVGPKAAKLGELKHHFPDAVAPGLAIPFGVFRELLKQPMNVEGQSQSVFDWMVGQYSSFENMSSADRQIATETFRARLQAWITQADPGDAFRKALRHGLEQVFGADGSYGVFVRSDTNVEDLPGFTGAGLNLTVPNVVGFENILSAIPRVWASPFSARAFAWRQAHMDQPEHVYPAILLMQSVDSDKSGVMVTQNIDTGDPDSLSVAVNEGVGGAVDGQSAESLRINLKTAQVQLMARATAPIRRKINPAGGITKLAASGDDSVLKPLEISRLIELAKLLPQRFPAIIDDNGRTTPADIEFGFLKGDLRLFQIRPFLQSDLAMGNAYLHSLDSKQSDLETIRVSLLDKPQH